MLEIGADRGANTRRLARFCAVHGVDLHVVDPEPRFDPARLERAANEIVVHRARSLDALPGIGPVDVALIDGDHDWCSVHDELALLWEWARAAGRAAPLVVCHGVCRPYGRR